MYRIAAICLALLLGALDVNAATAADEKQINELYRRGLNGDKAAVAECIARLEAVLTADRGNQMARVYLGSAYTLRSRDMGFGPKKLQVLKQGVALMDEAVAAAPADPKIRLARALTTSALPGILGYGAGARRDFDELAGLAKRAPEKFERGDLQIIFYNAALSAKKTGDRDRATALLRDAQLYSADPTLAQKVDAELVRQ